MRAAYGVVLFAFIFNVNVKAEAKKFLGNNADSTKELVLKRIPMGTKTAQAVSAMEADGFRCKEMKNQAFAYGDSPQKNHPPADIVWCDLSSPDLVTKKRFQVIFVQKDSLVLDVFAATGIAGP